LTYTNRCWLKDQRGFRSEGSARLRVSSTVDRLLGLDRLPFGPPAVSKRRRDPATPSVNMRDRHVKRTQRAWKLPSSGCQPSRRHRLPSGASLAVGGRPHSGGFAELLGFLRELGCCHTALSQLSQSPIVLSATRRGAYTTKYRARRGHHHAPANVHWISGTIRVATPRTNGTWSGRSVW